MCLSCQPNSTMSESILAHSVSGGSGSVNIESGSKTAQLNLSQRFQENDGTFKYFMFSAFALNIVGSCILYVSFPSISINASLRTGSRDVDNFILKGYWACNNNNQIIRAISSETELYDGNPRSNRYISSSMPKFSMSIPLITPEVEIGVALNGDISGDGSGFSNVTLTHSGVNITCEYSVLLLS